MTPGNEPKTLNLKTCWLPKIEAPETGFRHHVSFKGKNPLTENAPSTANTCPDMKEAAERQKNATAVATSTGSATRLAGVLLTTSRRNSSFAKTCDSVACKHVEQVAMRLD